jgi:hypothetical protein
VIDATMKVNPNSTKSPGSRPRPSASGRPIRIEVKAIAGIV